VRVELDLGERETADDVREYARNRRISQIAWISEQGVPTIESIS
jgi:ATP phosphoribosyltransferase regulatory subunit